MRASALKFATLTALGLALVTPAFAQDAPADEEGGIRDIVVAAQKRAENVQDIPIAITASGTAHLRYPGRVEVLKRMG